MQVRLFGDAELVGRDRSSTLSSGRPHAVLALLALDAGTTVPLDRLADALWDGEPPGDPVHALRATVSRLRNSLRTDGWDPDLVEAAPGGYRLAIAPDQLDLLAFDRLVDETVEMAAVEQAGPHDVGGVVAAAERAFDLWRGVPLATFASFAFTDVPRRRWGERRADLVQAWSTAAIELGRTSRVADVVGEEIELDPYRERLWASLALALYHDDRQTEAVRALQRARSTLADAGLEVSEHLADVERQILGRTVVATRTRRHEPRSLPTSLDSFVGREVELTRLVELATAARLVTITGPGGVGKTRLALEFARHDRTCERVAFVDLAAIEHPESVPGSIAEALRVELQERSDLGHLVASWAGGRPALVVVDNSEHVIDAVAGAAVAVVGAHPTVRMLVTSREPLAVRGEHVVALGPLSIPDADGTIDGAEPHPAVRLFLDRAQAADGSFRVGADDASDIVHIVRRLDGIPLAIELAAMRLRTHTLGELADALDDMTVALGAGPRDVDARHRTLDAAIGWSHRLLDEEGRRALHWLSVLVGPFARHVGARLAACGDQLVDGERRLDQLIDKSLVVRVGDETSMLRLLEPIRQFASRHLGADRVDATTARDAIYVEIARRYLDRDVRDAADTRQAMASAAANLDAAARSLLDQGRADDAAIVTAALATDLAMAGRYADARSALERCAATSDRWSNAAALSMLDAAMWLAGHDGDYSEAEHAARAALAADPTYWSAFNLLGSVTAERGELVRAVGLLERAVDAAPPDFLPARCNLSAVLAWSGRLDESAACLDELESLAAEREERALIGSIRGVWHRMAGRPDVAASLLDDHDARLQGTVPQYVADFMRCERALVAVELGEPDRALLVLDEVRHRAGGAPSNDIALRADVVAAAALAVGDTPTTDALYEIAVRARSAGAFGLVAEIADVAAWSVTEAVGPDVSRLVGLATALRDGGPARDPWQQRRLARIDADVPEGWSRTDLVREVLEFLEVLRH